MAKVGAGNVVTGLQEMLDRQMWQRLRHFNAIFFSYLSGLLHFNPP